MAERPSYQVPSATVNAQIEVMRSRFLAVLAPSGDRDEAQAFIKSTKQAYPDASHHCFAFTIGPPGSSWAVGCSDDGEPHNSAGRPILDVLNHADIGDLVCVVVRWFGGTKLGRGRLARAYGDAAQAAVAQIDPMEKVFWVKASVALEYGHSDAFLRELSSVRAEIVSESYGVQIQYELRLDERSIQVLSKRIGDLTRGKSVLKLPEHDG